MRMPPTFMTTPTTVRHILVWGGNAIVPFDGLDSAGVSRFSRGRRPDIEDVDAQYRSFIAYKVGIDLRRSFLTTLLQERLRQRRERQAHMSHAPPEFWNEFSPGHENKFESVYRSPYHRGMYGGAPIAW